MLSILLSIGKRHLASRGVPSHFSPLTSHLSLLNSHFSPLTSSRSPFRVHTSACLTTSPSSVSPPTVTYRCRSVTLRSHLLRRSSRATSDAIRSRSIV